MKGPLTLSALLFATSVALAGGPAPGDRALLLGATCDGGTNAGNPCMSDESCPGGACDLPVLKGSVSALVTLIVDDDTDNWGGGASWENVITATVLLEVRKDGTQLLAQTYVNNFGNTLLDLVQSLRLGPNIADNFNPLNEAEVEGQANAGNLIGRFLFQDGDSELADDLRTLLGTTGKPVILGVPKKANQVLFANRVADDFASVVRLKVKIGFVEP